MVDRNDFSQRNRSKFGPDVLRHNIRSRPFYCRGRRLPPYLLGRAYDNECISSDGTSKFSINTDSPITSANDTTSNILTIPHSYSSTSVACITNTLNWPANSASSGFQHESNSVVSSIHNEPSETRSIRSNNQSTFHATYTVDKRSSS